MREKALHYLAKDPTGHIDMLEPLRRETGEVVLAEEERGALLYLPAAKLYLASAATPEDGGWLVDGMDNAVLAAAHQDWLADMIAKRFGLRTTMCCRQAVWTHSSPPHCTSPQPGLEIRPLSPDRTGEVEALYSHDIGSGYIRGRILAGELFGAFFGVELAGFIGLHEEGSMGMLEVVPSHRRKGIGAQLIASLCEKLLDKGWTPFSQFTTDNTASEKLHAAMGFALSDSLVYWLEPGDETGSE